MLSKREGEYLGNLHRAVRKRDIDAFYYPAHRTGSAWKAVQMILAEYIRTMAEYSV